MEVKKMFKALKKAVDTGNGASFKMRLGRKVEALSPLSFRETVNAYNAAVRGESYETIDEQVMRVCKHYGMPCRESGVGWILG